MPRDYSHAEVYREICEVVFYGGGEMSASICWEPVSKSPASLYALAPQRFMETLQAIGLRIPGEAGQEHITALAGMEVLFNESDPQKNPYSQLIEAIEKHDRVRLWAEY
jgi:hypothetical protein